jgi:hypothetical protein
MLIASGLAVAGLIVLVMLLMWDPGRGYTSNDTTWP